MKPTNVISMSEYRKWQEVTLPEREQKPVLAINYYTIAMVCFMVAFWTFFLWVGLCGGWRTVHALLGIK